MLIRLITGLFMNFFREPSFQDKYGHLDFFSLKKPEQNYTYDKKDYYKENLINNLLSITGVPLNSELEIPRADPLYDKFADFSNLIVSFFNFLDANKELTISYKFAEYLVDEIISLANAIDIPVEYVALQLYAASLCGKKLNPFYEILGNKYVQPDTFSNQSLTLRSMNCREEYSLNNPLYLAAYFLDEERLNEFLKNSTLSSINLINPHSMSSNGFGFLKEKDSQKTLAAGIGNFEVDYISSLDMCVLLSFTSSFYGFQKKKYMSVEINNRIKSIYKQNGFDFNDEKEGLILFHSVESNLLFTFEDWNWNAYDNMALKKLITCNKFTLETNRSEHFFANYEQRLNMFVYKFDDITEYLKKIPQSHYNHIILTTMLESLDNKEIQNVVKNYLNQPEETINDDEPFDLLCSADSPFNQEEQENRPLSEHQILTELTKPLFMIKAATPEKWHSMSADKNLIDIVINNFSQLTIEKNMHLSELKEIKKQKLLLNFNMTINELLFTKNGLFTPYSSKRI